VGEPFLHLMADSVEQMLGRLEGKFDAFIQTQQQQHDRLNNHGDRISKLERWQAWVLGACAVVVFAIGSAVKFWK
jgi:hypothetical protein